jgi:hypothetical protein
MHKRIIGTQTAPESGPSESWLDLQATAEVELTSEEAGNPIENVFASDTRSGWKAAATGIQTIRLIFKPAQSIRRIRLEFRENQFERTQEFALHYSEENSTVLREILRQQWTFSPQGSTTEIEEYSVDLPQVHILQLTIDPDRGQHRAVATLHRWRIA